MQIFKDPVPGEYPLRVLLFVYILCVASPIRYWMIRADDADYTWLFALNYAAAHGMAFGRDLIWTNGPLGVLTFPQNIGANLPHALLFQMGVWILLAATFGYAIFGCAIPLRRLALFSAGLGLASPLFWFNRNLETLLFATALTLLVLVRLRGGTLRYLTALAILGIIPLAKLSIAIPAAFAIAGFVLDRALELRWKAWPLAVQAILIPPAFTAVGLWLTLPSWNALGQFLHANLDIVSGYSSAMSYVGPSWEMAVAVVTFAAFALFLWVAVPRPLARFFGCLLLPPLLFGMKHGFVRQDDHIVNFFCLAALVLGLVALAVDFEGWRNYAVLAAMVIMPLVCLPRLVSYKNLLGDVSGLRAVRSMWLASRSLMAGSSPEKERALMGAQAPPSSVEPEISGIVKDAPVAFLSMNYSASYFDGLDLRIYPVVQRYSAYTPYLDHLNAEWIRERGPRFLVFDGGTIGGRHPWTETPAMWAAVYRDYDTRLLTAANLLLERRREPRFTRFEAVRRMPLSMPGELDLTASDNAGFWSVTCGLTPAGSLDKLLFRVPLVSMTTVTDAGDRHWYRSITEVLTSPSPGSWLPATLPEFATALRSDSAPAGHIRKLVFGSWGAGLYQSPCDAELWRAVK